MGIHPCVIQPRSELGLKSYISFNLSNSIKKLNKLVNADLKHLANWLNGNKISLNIKKLKK